LITFLFAGFNTIHSEAPGPARVAILAFIHLDQVPANHREMTGAEVAPGLGSLTPGASQSWQRIASTIYGTRPMVRPFRSAI
jgi:hypothetical protein